MVMGILLSRHHKWKKLRTYIPIVIGLPLIYISTTGPLSESGRKIDEIINIDSTKVSSIIFQPTRQNGRENLTMFEKDSVVTERKLINKICSDLHEAKVAEEGFFKES